MTKHGKINASDIPQDGKISLGSCEEFDRNVEFTIKASFAGRGTSETKITARFANGNLIEEFDMEEPWIN